MDTGSTLAGLCGEKADEAVFRHSCPASPIAVTNETVIIYPMSVIETNLLTRERFYFNANDVAVHTATVGVVGYPEDWIEDAYGEPPAYLVGDELDTWYEDRDPRRCIFSFDLLSTSDVPAYVEMMTNAVSSISSTQAWEDLLMLYSNDIAAVGILEAGGSIGIYLHAPTNVTMLDVFRSEDLTNSSAWAHQGLRREAEESALAQGEGRDVASLQRVHQKTGERFATLSRMVAKYGVVELQQDLLANIVFDINPPSFEAFSEVGEMWPAFGALLALNPDSEIIVKAFEDAESKYRANALGMLLVKLRGSEEARKMLEGKGPKGFIVTYDPIAEILQWGTYPTQQHSSNSVSRAQGISRDPD